MPHRPLEDWEDPEPDDEDLDEDDEYACPNCGASVYEDSERCPACGDYITPQSKATLAPGNRWFMIVIIAMIRARSPGCIPGVLKAQEGFAHQPGASESFRLPHVKNPRWRFSLVCYLVQLLACDSCVARF